MRGFTEHFRVFSTAILKTSIVQEHKYDNVLIIYNIKIAFKSHFGILP